MIRKRDNNGRFVASMKCRYEDDGKEKNGNNYGEFYGNKNNPSIQILNDDLIFTIHGITGYFMLLLLFILFLPWIYFILKSGYVGYFFDYFAKTLVNNAKINEKDRETPGL